MGVVVITAHTAARSVGRFGTGLAKTSASPARCRARGRRRFEVRVDGELYVCIKRLHLEDYEQERAATCCSCTVYRGSALKVPPHCPSVRTSRDVVAGEGQEDHTG